MTEDELEALLGQWGRAYGERPPAEWQEDSTLTGAHPLAVAQQYARPKRARLLDAAWRRTHGAALTRWAANGMLGRPPGWASDPVPCHETRSSGAKSLAQFNRTFTPMLAVIEWEALSLQRAMPVPGACLRARYCTRGTDADRVDWVASRLGGERLSVRQFREHVHDARLWMQGRLSS